MPIHGQVIRLEPAHGFGFIRDDRAGDWFFVAAGVRDNGFGSLRAGMRVVFLHERTFDGPRATDVHSEPGA
jgi:cold shock CspA family protein